MDCGRLNKLVFRGGLSIVAALMLSGAVMAQAAGMDEAVSEPAVDVVANEGAGAVDDGTVVAIDEGIAVGEPDPNDTVVDDGGVIGDGTEPDGIMYTMDGGFDDAGGGGIVGGVIGGGGFGDDALGYDPIEGAATGGGEIGDGMIGDGVIGEDEVVDTEACIDCNVIVPGRPVNPTEVQRNLTDNAPVIVARRGSSNGPSAAALALASPMAQCMIQHPRSAWICEWQNGAGQ